MTLTVDRPVRPYYGPASVPAIGAQRRVLSLGTVGWSQREIAAAAGISRLAVQAIAEGRTARVCPETHDGVVAAFDHLGALPMTERNHSRTHSRNTALRRGGVPPMAWDDLDLDDPDAHPPTWAVRHVPPGRPGVCLEDVEELISHGCDYHAIASRLGVRRDSIYMALRRAGRHDLVDALDYRASLPSGFSP